MKREVYSQHITKTALNITRNRIDSMRKNDITKSGCRVYDQGYLGISGFFGDPNEEHWKAAEENLALHIPYEYPTEAGKVRTEDRREEVLTQKEFLERSEAMLEKLHEQNPNFIFSNKLMAVETTETLKNDEGLSYEYRDMYYAMSVIFKHLDSKAVFDGGVGQYSRTLNPDQFLADSHKILTAFQQEAQLPEEATLPIVLNMGADVMNKIVEGLSAEALGKKTSIFADKLGQKVFSDQVNVFVDRSAENVGMSFFDMEGSTLENDKIGLIENGTIVRGYCDKKNAAEFGYTNTASGEGGYDDVPALRPSGLQLKPTGKTLQELVGQGKAIYIDTMSGGDSTAEGNFASPVQLAYLMENGHLVGRLTDFNLSGNLYEMFGKDFIGVTEDKPFFNDHMLVVKMKLN